MHTQAWALAAKGLGRSEGCLLAEGMSARELLTQSLSRTVLLVWNEVLGTYKDLSRRVPRVTIFRFIFSSLFMGGGFSRPRCPSLAALLM